MRAERRLVVTVCPREPGAVVLPVEHSGRPRRLDAHAVRVARLPRHHTDPFDRALVAQALVEPLTLLTHDAKLAPYGSAVRVA